MATTRAIYDSPQQGRQLLEQGHGEWSEVEADGCKPVNWPWQASEPGSGEGGRECQSVRLSRAHSAHLGGESVQRIRRVLESPRYDLGR